MLVDRTMPYICLFRQTQLFKCSLTAGIFILEIVVASGINSLRVLVLMVLFIVFTFNYISRVFPSNSTSFTHLDTACLNVLGDTST